MKIKLCFENLESSVIEDADITISEEEICILLPEGRDFSIYQSDQETSCFVRDYLSKNSPSVVSIHLLDFDKLDGILVWWDRHKDSPEYVNPNQSFNGNNLVFRKRK